MAKKKQEPKDETPKDPRELWQEELDALYSLALEKGCSKEKAQELCKKRMEFLLLVETTGDPSDHTGILRKIPKDKIQGYDKVDEKTQQSLLYYLGYDIERPIWENAMAVVVNDRVVLDVFVCGSERTDDEWTKTRYASFESKVRGKGDISLAKELNKLSNGRGYFE